MPAGAMFSVVIPLYNKAHTIAETLQSVLAQDFPDFEVIVVDDGSTDDGATIVERDFPDARIRLIRQHNQGASAARNRGAAATRHELIAFLDGDDLWDPGFLDAMRRAAEQFPEAGLYCCAGTIRHPDGSGYARYSDRYGGVTQKVAFFQSPDFFSHTSSNVVQKSRFDQAGGFPSSMRKFEDQVLFQTVALHAEVVFCPRPLAVHRKGVPGQLSADSAHDYLYRLERTNTTYAQWSALDRARRDPLFGAHALYEFRCQIHQVSKDPAKVRYLLEHVDPRLRNALSPLERFLYPRPALRRASQYCNRALQAAWRSRGYPAREYQRNLASVLP